MKTKEVTICGKPVKLAYCYATEIAYNDLAGEELPPFVQQAAMALNENKMPTVKNAIYAIISAMMPCYKDDEQPPVTDSNIIEDATPEELAIAIGTIIVLYAEFYHIPKNEPEEKPDSNGTKKGKKRKNA